MARRGAIRTVLSSMLVVATLTFGLLAVAPATGAGASKPTTATWAEQPSLPPNFIFPFYPGSLCSTANIAQFQWLMYRPLYWYGDGSTPSINTSYSVADMPVYGNGDKTVTINMKNYMWSNGEPVNAQDVLFFLNLDHAEKANFCGYVPGFMPDNIASVTAPSATKLVITTKSAVNSFWFTYNELSQITPLPEAWDITGAGASPGSGGCYSGTYGSSATDAACAKVYTFLASEAGYDPANPSATNNSFSTYASNPIWQVVDGPWHLTSFNADGNLTMAANSKYTGPVKPTLKTFSEVPYTTDNAEFDALVGNQLSVGYLPFQDVQTAATTQGASTGPNNTRISGTYNFSPLYTWSINYAVINFNSTGNNGTTGDIYHQAYIRQAMQHLVDQPLYIKKVLKNYAEPTYGPVPVKPPNTYASSYEKKNPFPYSPSKAKSLLSSHGWKIVPGGSDVCEKAGSGSSACGAGIPKGTKLNLNMQVATGLQWLTTISNAERSSWSSEGINVTLQPETFNTVIGSAVACTASPGPCTWQTLFWGGGWTFFPDSYPSGEELFGNGSVANYGSYGPTVSGFSTNSALINKTINSTQSLTAWENYLAKQVPVIFQPFPSPSLTEIAKGLSGVNPQNVYWALTPETWRFS